jgi:hypothetical protein
MGYHLISIDEDQLRAPVADKEEFLIMLGSAVLLACLESENPTVTIRSPNPETNDPEGAPILSIRHVAEIEEKNVRLWVWESDDAVAIADLSTDELETLSKIVTLRQRALSQSGS